MVGVKSKPEIGFLYQFDDHGVVSATDNPRGLYNKHEVEREPSPQAGRAKHNTRVQTTAGQPVEVPTTTPRGEMPKGEAL